MTARMRSVLTRAWPYAAFFVVLLVMSAPNGLDTITSVAQVPLLTSAADFRAAAGDTDAGSLMGAALSISENGKLISEQMWVFNLWPPGMVAVDLLLVGVEGATGIPAVLLMVLLNALVWAAALGFVFSVVRRRHGLLVAGVFALAVLVYSGTSIWGTKLGLFYSDSFGALAFCIGLVLLYLCVEQASLRRRLTLAAVAGVFFATAAYFRATFELVNNVLVGGGAVLAILFFVVYRLWPRRNWARTALAVTLPIAVAGLAYMAVTLPWRVLAGTKIRPGDFRWSTVSDIISGQRWIPTSELTGQSAFLNEGHINWACRLDAAECERVASLELGSSGAYTGSGHFTNAQFDALTADVALSHPLEFLNERFSMLTLGFSSETGSPVGALAVAESLLLAIALVALVVVFIRRAGYRNPGFVVLAIATAGQFATLLLFHQESRYFLAIELGIIVMGALILPGARRSGESRKSVDTASESSAAP